MSPSLFKNSSILVTGASSGIGKCFAQELARQGANLILTARSQHELDKLADELRQQFSITVHVIPADLAIPDTAQRLFSDIKSRNLSVDFLVNNAGFGKWAHFLEEELETYDHMLAVNISALTQLTYLFLPKMLENKKGGIINVASTAAFQPVPYIALYSASKAFVLNLTEALAAEYKHSGVHFMALCPGNTNTNFTKVANADTTGMSSMTPEHVVKSALNAFFRGAVYHVPGSANYFSAQLSRLLPRQMLTRIIANMFVKRIGKTS